MASNTASKTTWCLWPIHAGQNRFVAVEYLVIQAHPNLGEVVGLVDV